MFGDVFLMSSKKKGGIVGSLDSVSTRNLQTDTQVNLLAQQMKQEKEVAAKLLDMGQKASTTVQSSGALYTNKGANGHVDTFA